MIPRARRRLVLAFKFSLAIGLLYWLFYSGRLDLRALVQLREGWIWLVVAQIPFALTVYLSAWRWQVLLQTQGIRYSVCATGSLTLIGVFFNQVFIGSTGGDVYRAYAVASDCPGKKSAAIVSVFVDRALGLMALLVIVPIAVVWNAEFAQHNSAIYSFFLMVMGVLLASIMIIPLFFSKTLRRSGFVQYIVQRLPMREILKQVDEAITVHRYQTRAMVLVAGLSVVLQLLVIATNICLSYALVENPPAWALFFLIIPMAHLTMALPVNPPGAIGTGEAIYAYLFGLAGFAHGALICVLQRVTFLSWSIPGAILYVMRRHTAAVIREA